MHGGLRYLQKADLIRFLSSVNERRWFLKNFPDLVSPLPCLMPLYGEGLHRPPILRIALLANNLLSHGANKNLPIQQTLPNSHVIDKKEVIRIFPFVDRSSLKGGAVWYDGTMPASQRVLIEILRWSVNLGSTSINYMKADAIKVENGHVSGVRASDKESGREYRFSAPVVINTTGPWARKLATRFDKDIPNLFRSSMAWNVLIDKPSLSNHALAVKSKRSGSQIFFLHPWNGRILAGTVHKAHPCFIENPRPQEIDITKFIGDLNAAIPSLDLLPSNITRYFCGLLPAKRSGTAELANRPFSGTMESMVALLACSAFLGLNLPRHAKLHRRRLGGSSVKTTFS